MKWVATLAVLLGVASTASSSAPPGGWIAFSPYDPVGGDSSIMLVGSDGGERRPLSAGGSATWSPDGARMAVCCDSGDRIVLVGVEDGSRTPLAVGRTPAWSPDGRRLAFVRGDTGPTSEIYAIDADGTNERRLTTDSWPDGGPMWSPDGAHLAYTSERAPSRVVVIRADGSGAREVAVGESPSWAPDGSRLAFRVSDELQLAASGMFVVPLDGGEPRRVGFAASHAPAWSADGSRLLYAQGWTRGTCIRCPEPALSVVFANADGSGTVALTDAPQVDERPSWSPGGTRIVFGRRDRGSVLPSAVYTMNADGTCETRLTAGTHLGWQPGGAPPPPLRCAAVGLRGPTETSIVRGAWRPFAWTVTAKNDGNLPATQVVVEERGGRRLKLVAAKASQGSCTVARHAVCRLVTLPPGAEAKLTFVARAPAGLFVTRTITARSAEPDGYRGDNLLSALTYISACTLVGTMKDDVVTGGSRRDVICGRQGDDVLAGAGGGDRIEGGDGSDRITGGPGRDRLLGEGGPDRIFARDGERDVVVCGGNVDRVAADHRDRVSRDCERVLRR